jgi:hypothetical protein
MWQPLTDPAADRYPEPPDTNPLQHTYLWPTNGDANCLYRRGLQSVANTAAIIYPERPDADSLQYTCLRHAQCNPDYL